MKYKFFSLWYLKEYKEALKVAKKLEKYDKFENVDIVYSIDEAIETATKDIFIIGGGMAFTFLKQMGYDIGASLVEDELLDDAQHVMDEARKLIQSLKGKNIIGGGVACLMPTKDNPNNITSMVAASIMFEIICLISLNLNK